MQPFVFSSPRVRHDRRLVKLIMYFSAVAFALLTVVYLSLGAFTGEVDNVPRLGAVASLDARCSQIGTDVLREGGNAADAVSERCLQIIQPRVDASL